MLSPASGSYLQAITDRLPADIAVTEAVEIPMGFNVIGDAKCKLSWITAWHKLNLFLLTSLFIKTSPASGLAKASDFCLGNTGRRTKNVKIGKCENVKMDELRDLVA